MRIVLAVLTFLALAAPAAAQQWNHYENPRFGYEVLVPPGFVPDGPPPANGDGQVFVKTTGTQLLRVYGGNIVEGDFEGAVGRAMSAAEDAGWALSYKRITPRWTSYSGTRSGMILYARAISLCGGTQFASFEIEYPDDDLTKMNDVIDRMVPSLKTNGNGVSC